MRLLTAVSGVRVPQQAPQSTRKRVLLFCFGLSPLRVQRHARGQARRHAEPQWTRLRPQGRTIAIPSRCSLRGFESRGKRHRTPENGCFCFVSGSHPCAYNQYARGQARRHAEPQWTRLRPRRRTIAIPSRCSLRGFEQSCQRQRQNNELKGKRLRHFTFKIISGACACAGGDGAGEGGGGTGHAPY